MDDQVVTLTVTASDDAMVSGSDSVTITIPGTDPTVSIETADQTVPGGTVLQLQATSRDSDSSTVGSYAWATDPVTTGTFSDAAVEDPTWTAPATTMDDQVVTLTLTVTASDDAMVSGSDSVTITIPGTDPTVSIETADQTSLEARFSSSRPRLGIRIAARSVRTRGPRILLLRERSVTRR